MKGDDSSETAHPHYLTSLPFLRVHIFHPRCLPPLPFLRDHILHPRCLPPLPFHRVHILLIRTGKIPKEHFVASDSFHGPKHVIIILSCFKVNKYTFWGRIFARIIFASFLSLGSTLKEKNLLLLEQILSFKN